MKYFKPFIFFLLFASLTFAFIFTIDSYTKEDDPQKTANDINTMPNNVISYPLEQTTVNKKYPRQVVTANYIELNRIEKITKFRSAAGHDYWDDFERCRSMKHYFAPPLNVDSSTVKIFSPFDGEITKIFQEWAGFQIHITSKENPNIIAVIFHVNIYPELQEGTMLTSGQQIGTHIGSQTMSDIAISENVDNARRLISYFDIMTDQVFEEFKTHGITSREQMIYTKEYRDANPLQCDGEAFVSARTEEDWVVLN